MVTIGSLETMKVNRMSDLPDPPRKKKILIVEP